MSVTDEDTLVVDLSWCAIVGCQWIGKGTGLDILDLACNVECYIGWNSVTILRGLEFVSRKETRSNNMTHLPSTLEMTGKGEI